MKNNTTELVFILDASGSMANLVQDTLGGFNAMIDAQKKKDGKCLVSTVVFSNESRVIHDRAELEEIQPMTDSEYTVGGCTALLDAIGGAVKHISNIHKYARAEDVPENTVFVITTDGMENASRIYDSAKVKDMIEHMKRERGWEFIFVAANIDAVETAKGFGITEDRAVNYHADALGTECLYNSISETLCAVREGTGIRPTWSKKLNEDYNTRKRKS